ncbi:MAG: hypothetical protein EOP52_05435 [Sphingobacteriales bacterium]|nr:MAG: hypothetical protein EOP52_05435 [Sphingobacteriales bacterium]
MEQIISYADYRLLQGCIHCGGLPDTRDHVPSKCLLDRPYPENIPVTGCCNSCNQSFSIDEQYLVCLIESVLCGSTDPEKINRKYVADIMRRVPSLRARIENAKTEVDGQISFIPETERIYNVMLKLARGHAAFELSKLCYEEPDRFWYAPLSALSRECRDYFNEVHFQHILGEVESRNTQRLFITQIAVTSETGIPQEETVIINDWVYVQDGRYRYLAIDDVCGIVIRIVIGEYLACEIGWGTVDGSEEKE